jgi:hypothetical protein
MLVVIMMAMASGSTLWASEDEEILEPDDYYAQLMVTWLNAEQEYDFDGNLRGLFSDTASFREGQFGMTDVGFYGEWGITDWLTGIASTHYIVAVREARFRKNGRDTTLSSSGLGDLWLGGRVQLFDTTAPVLATASLSVKIPTGSPYQSIPLGTGVVDYELSLAARRNFVVFDDMPGFGKMAGGFRLRNGANDAFLYKFETGMYLLHPLLMLASLDGMVSTADFDKRLVDQSVRALVNDQTFARWNLSLTYTSSPTMDLLVAYNQQIAGRNGLAASTFSLGIAWKR